MDYDLVLVIGFVLLLFAIPSLMAAWIEKRPPFIPAAVLAVAVILTGTAIILTPRPLSPGEIPHVFVDVIGR